MPSVADRLDFFPPRPQGTGRALAVAVMAHLALLGALAWGVNWKREAPVTTMEAELWSSLPQQAAPKLQEAPPAPPAPTQPEPPAAKAPDIAVEKEAAKPAPKPTVQPEVKPPPKPAPKVEAKVDKAAEAKKLTAQQAAAHQAQVDRAMKLAEGSGAVGSPGTSQRSAGMSDAWNARVKARVNPQIIYSGDRSTLKDLELEISILPDGTIKGRPKVIKSSGSAQWDDAVARAFEKAEVLPRDNGKLPPPVFYLKWIAKE